MHADDDIGERPFSAEEFEARVRAPMSDAERNEIDTLIEWFTQRYPTARERLAWARRAWRRAQALKQGR